MTILAVVSHSAHASTFAEFSEGSITVHPYNDTAYESVELGASIFVNVNKNLQRAAREFNLSLYGFEDEDGDLGIWDGEQFLYTVRFTREDHLAFLSSLADGGQNGSIWFLARQH